MQAIIKTPETTLTAASRSVCFTVRNI